jgi:RNA polymerase sigma factor (sigma-70 family)
MDRLSDWVATNLHWLKSRWSRGRDGAHDAEDLIQESILRVYEYRAKGGEIREPEAVLLRTISRLAMNQARDAHRELYSKETLEDLLLIDERPLPDEVLDAQQRVHRVKQVLETLPPRTKEILLLHRLAETQREDIAKQLGISVSAVQKHIARAVAALMMEKLHE